MDLAVLDSLVLGPPQLSKDESKNANRRKNGRLLRKDDGVLLPARAFQ